MCLPRKMLNSNHESTAKVGTEMEEDRRPGQPKNGIPERESITARNLKVRKKALGVGTVWGLGWMDTYTHVCACIYIIWKEIIHQT